MDQVIGQVVLLPLCVVLNIAFRIGENIFGTFVWLWVLY
jgi:hypothetical protein